MNVFRSIEEEGADAVEFFQTGVELVGDDSPEADAEVVAFGDCLYRQRVCSFKIAMGHMGFLNGLLEEVIPGQTTQQQELKKGLLGRDYVGYRESIEALDLEPKLKAQLEAILRLRGGKRDLC